MECTGDLWDKTNDTDVQADGTNVQTNDTNIQAELIVVNCAPDFDDKGQVVDEITQRTVTQLTF